MRFGTDKDIAKCIRRAQKQGWDVTTDGGQHIKVVPPNGKEFRVPMTPGSRQRIKRAICQFRAAGLQ